MNQSRIFFFFVSLLVATSIFSQKQSKSDKAIVANLKTNIGYLADDKLEGRRAGSPGEKLAREYISTQFRTIGIVPKGTDDYYQAFDINDGKQVADGSYFSINGKNLELN